MISLYRPGRSPLHRLPAPVKLALFAVGLIAVSVFTTTPLALAIVAVVTLGVFALAGCGPLQLGIQLWALRWVVVITAIPQVIFLTPVQALVNTGRVSAAILLASVLTLTTPMADLIDTIERVASPLAHVGIAPSRIALLLTLAITTVPVIAGFSAQIREAQRSRGVRVSIARMLMPLLVLALKHADDLGDALRARGIE